MKSSKRADVQDAFLTGEFFRSRAEVFSVLVRKKFPPNNIQRKRSRELRCSGLLAFFSFRRICWRCSWSPKSGLHPPSLQNPRQQRGGRGKAVANQRASTSSPSSSRVFASPVTLIDQRSANSPVALNPTIVRRPPVGLLHFVYASLEARPPRSPPPFMKDMCFACVPSMCIALAGKQERRASVAGS